MLCGWKMSYSQKIGFFWSKFRWSPPHSKLEAHMRSFLGDFPFVMEQAICALTFSKSIQSSCAQSSPCPKGKTPTQIGHHMWKILAPTFVQLMRLPPKTSNAKVTKKPLCLEYEAFMCYFDPHGSGHHPTLVDTFHPCRLPLVGRKPIRILGGDPFRVVWAFKG